MHERPVLPFFDSADLGEQVYQVIKTEVQMLLQP